MCGGKGGGGWVDGGKGGGCVWEGGARVVGVCKGGGVCVWGARWWVCVCGCEEDGYHLVVVLLEKKNITSQRFTTT